MRNLLPFFCAVTVACSLSAQTLVSPKAIEHQQSAASHHERLGDVHFPTSCAPAVQNGITRGVALLHSFGYTEAELQFEQVASADPHCAIAHWGIAMTQYQELWGRPSPEQLKRGEAQMAKARELAAQPGAATPREHAYIAAMSAFFAPGNVPFQQRADAYEAKMNALHAAFPNDVEGAAFDALAILASTPPDDSSLTHQHQALAILFPLFKLHPDHPGLAHYIIHTCDTPALAPEGLAAAERYAQIAPSSPHALHMPAHIFARLGMWQPDIASNLASKAASLQDEAAGEPGAAHQLHADEFLVYAYLQVGQDAKAKAVVDQLGPAGAKLAAMPGDDDMKMMGHYADNELRVIYLLEMHDWQALAAIDPEPGSAPDDELDIYWGQAIAAGHLRNAALAQAALQAYDADVAALRKKYPDDPVVPDVKRFEMVGWEQFAQGHPDAALASMHSAVAQQDKMGQGEVDIPAPEMLGDLLMLEHQPTAALAAYKLALKLSPNRLNDELSAAAAARATGHPEEALALDKQAARQTDDAKFSQRPQLLEAVKAAAGTEVAAN